jgi:hypothetical protein
VLPKIKKTKKTKEWRFTSVVEHLPSITKHWVQSLIPQKNSILGTPDKPTGGRKRKSSINKS